MESKLKILHINTWPHGGAGEACKRISSALNKNNVSSKVLFLSTDSTNPEYISFNKSANSLLFKLKFLLLRILSFLPTFGKERAYVNSLYSPFDIRKSKEYQEADIIHLHWVSKFVNIDTVFKDGDKRFVWTIHDMYPITGLNHYNTGFNSKQYQKLIEKRKEQIITNYKKSVIHPTAPSRWLTEQINSSGVFNTRAINIPNCVDTKVFFPKDAIDKSSKHCILFVSENINDDRKGFKLLIQALNLLPNPENYCLYILGKGEVSNINIDKVELGFVTDQEKLAQIYSDVDLFVIPSIEDNLPNTVVESLACGTPVVGFNIGGIPDMIDHMNNGYLVEEITSKELKNGIEWVLKNNTSGELSENARQKAITEFSQDKTANAYKNLYEKIVANNS